MPNHFHLIARTPQANLDRAMNYLLRETSREISILSKRINQSFGGPHFRCLISDLRYLDNVYKYVYRNPVEARLCSLVEEYPFSTLQGILGSRHLLFPVDTDERIFDSPGLEKTLAWLNHKPDPDELIALHSAVRKSHLDIRTTRRSGSPFVLSRLEKN